MENKEKPLSSKVKMLDYMGIDNVPGVLTYVNIQDLKQAVERLKDTATFITEKDNKLWIDFDEIDEIFGEF